MHVVRHHFESVNSSLKLRGNLPEKLSQPLLDQTHEHRSAKLRTPHEVILQGENRAGILGISLKHWHSIHATETESRGRGGALPLSPKGDSPRTVI
jgi:hypothetical protein